MNDASEGAGQQPGGVHFMSVIDARKALLAVSDEPGSGALCRAIAAYVMDPDNEVYSQPDDCFNFAMAYSDAGDTITCLRVCRWALGMYPYDTDLLAQAITAASGSGRFEEGLELIARAEQVPMKHWGVRPFMSITNFYLGYLRACDPKDIPEVLERALAVTHAFQKHRPWDERGYNLEAELLLFAGDVEGAREVLKTAIFEKIPGPDGTLSPLMASQCCVTMLSDVLCDSTDYEFVIKVAQRGIRGCAREQATSNVGFFVYREALAMDGIICSASQVRDGYGNPEKVRDALMTYRCAYGLVTSPGYRANIRKRYSILCHKSGIFDMPLEPQAQ